MQDGTLAERLAAVERALDDADLDGSGGSRGATGDLAARVADLEEHVDDLGAEVAELEAAVQAIRGYVGEVRHVNDEVERRADAALAKAETVEGLLTPGGPDRLPGSGPAEWDSGSSAAAGDSGSGPGPATGNAGSGPGVEDSGSGPHEEDLGSRPPKEDSGPRSHEGDSSSGRPGGGGPFAGVERQADGGESEGPADGDARSTDTSGASVGRRAASSDGDPWNRDGESEPSAPPGDSAPPDGDGLLERVLEVI